MSLPKTLAACIGTTMMAASVWPTLPAAGATNTTVITAYTQVSSERMSDVPGGQAFGSVSCPPGTRALGGGALLGSPGLGQNLNGSSPQSQGKGWQVWVNEAGAADQFTVYAVCGQGVTHYRLVGHTVQNPKGAHTQVSVKCPTGTVPLGGGAESSSTDTAVNLGSSIPTSTGWSASVNNASAMSASAKAVAICGDMPAGYSVVTGRVRAVPVGKQIENYATCPEGAEALSGGGYSESTSTAVTLNSTQPDVDWRVYVNNNSDEPTRIRALVVCANVQDATP